MRSRRAPEAQVRVHAEVLEADEEQIDAHGGGDEQRELQQVIDDGGGAPRADDVNQQRGDRTDRADDADDAESYATAPGMDLLHNASAFFTTCKSLESEVYYFSGRTANRLRGVRSLSRAKRGITSAAAMHEHRCHPEPHRRRGIPCGLREPRRLAGDSSPSARLGMTPAQSL